MMMETAMRKIETGNHTVYLMRISHGSDRIKRHYMRLYVGCTELPLGQRRRQHIRHPRGIVKFQLEEGGVVTGFMPIVVGISEYDGLRVEGAGIRLVKTTHIAMNTHNGTDPWRRHRALAGKALAENCFKY